MSDWWKASITAVFGFIAGLVAEPIRQRIVLSIQTQQVKRLLWDELTRIYLEVCDPRSADRIKQNDFERSLKFYPPHKYEYCVQNKREACYNIRGWMFIEDFYRRYIDLRLSCLEGELPWEEAVREIRYSFVSRSRLDERGPLMGRIEKYYEKRGLPALPPELWHIGREFE